MKKLFFSILAVLCTMTAMAQNDDYGNLCDEAVYVDSTLVQEVKPYEMYYFTANTEDLPLTVYFFPENNTGSDPVVYIDLTCEAGVYEDEKIRDIVDVAADMGMYFPLNLPFEKIEQDGQIVYKVSYDRSLLEIMAAFGIDYSVPAYVAFYSDIAGTIQMSNVKATTNCTDLCLRVEMQDTLHLQANTPAYYYFPVKEWEGSNMTFTWNGNAGVRAYLETDCEFDTLTSRYVYEFAEKDSRELFVQKVSELAVDNYIQSSEDGNIYAMFIAPEDGQVYVGDYVDHGNITINACIKNLRSTAIDFPTTGVEMAAKVPSKSYRLEASAIQDKNIQLKWKTTDNKVTVAYFANFCGFTLDPADPDVIDTVHFVFNEEEQAMIADIPRERVNNIVKQNTEGWLFMQIYRTEAGTFSWDEYEVIYPDCDSKSILLQPTDSVEMPADYYNTSYKLVVKDWLDHEHSFTWRSTRQAYIFIADSCSFPLAPYNIHVGKYMVVNPNDSVVMTKEDISTLSREFTDEYGNLYLRLRSTAAGELVVHQLPEKTGLFDNVIINGRNARLVLINQTLYIEISDPNKTEYYDLMGRKVEFED